MASVENTINGSSTRYCIYYSLELLLALYLQHILSVHIYYASILLFPYYSKLFRSTDTGKIAATLALCMHGGIMISNVSFLVTVLYMFCLILLSHLLFSFLSVVNTSTIKGHISFPCFNKVLEQHWNLTTTPGCLVVEWANLRNY